MGCRVQQTLQVPTQSLARSSRQPCACGGPTCTARLSSFSPSLSLRPLAPPFLTASASSLRASSSSLSAISAWMRSSSRLTLQNRSLTVLNLVRSNKLKS